MAKGSILIRLDEDLKKSFDACARSLGSNSTNYLRMLITQAVEDRETGLQRKVSKAAPTAPDAPKRGPGRPPKYAPPVEAAPPPRPVAPPVKRAPSWRDVTLSNWRDHVVEDEDGTQTMPILSERLGGRVVQVECQIDDFGEDWSQSERFWLDDDEAVAAVLELMNESAGGTLMALLRLESDTYREQDDWSHACRSIMITLGVMEAAED
jgi:hypothetical protein